MNDPASGILIKNHSEIAFTGDRKILLSLLAGVFSELDPAKSTSGYLDRILSAKNVYDRIYAIGFGKASLRMYEGIRRNPLFKPVFSCIIVPKGEKIGKNYPELEILFGNHPIPGKDTLASSETLLKGLEGHGKQDLIVVLISGGGSALFEMPLQGFTIDFVGELTNCLMRSGANIRELNIVRQAISKVKGGKLAQMLSPSEVHALIISDVPGDDPEIIASGPLTAPSNNQQELSSIVGKYSSSCLGLRELRGHFSKDNPKLASFEKIHANIILKNSDFVRSTASALSRSNQNVMQINEPITGDVEAVANYLISMAREHYNSFGKPFWLVGGGETTAQVHGEGVGGRNCELSLRISLHMKREERFMFSSIGTDGIDGVSPAMGGITDTWFAKSVDRIEVEDSIARSDSYTLLNKYNSAIITGYTGTNVSDVFVLYYAGQMGEK